MNFGVLRVAVWWKGLTGKAFQRSGGVRLSQDVDAQGGGHRQGDSGPSREQNACAKALRWGPQWIQNTRASGWSRTKRPSEWLTGAPVRGWASCWCLRKPWWEIWLFWGSERWWEVKNYGSFLSYGLWPTGSTVVLIVLVGAIVGQGCQSPWGCVTTWLMETKWKLCESLLTKWSNVSRCLPCPLAHRVTWRPGVWKVEVSFERILEETPCRRFMNEK